MITDKLNAAWGNNQAMQAVFKFRALAANVYAELQNTISSINEITAGASFADVDAEIKTKGQQIISILNQTKTALDAHSDFIDWKQPK